MALNDNKKNDFMSRANSILLGEISGRFDSVLDNRDNKFASTFLQLLRVLEIDIYPLDNSKLGLGRDIEYLEETENVKVLEVDLDYEWYKTNIGTFMGFEIKTNNPVLMQQTKTGKYEAVDVLENKHIVIDEHNAERYEKSGLFVYPNYFGERKLNAVSLILKSVKLQKKDVLLFLVLSLISALIGMSVSNAIGFITAGINTENDYSNVAAIGFAMMLSIMAGVLINIVINRTKSRITSSANYRVFISLICRIMNVSSANEKKISSKLVAMLMPFINSIDDIIGSSFVVILNFVQTILILGIISFYGHLAIQVVVIILIYGLAILVLQVISFKSINDLNEKKVKYNNLRTEFMDNIEAIKNNAIEDRMFYRFAVNFDEYMTLKLKQSCITEWMAIVGTLISSLGVMIIFLATASESIDDVPTVAVIVSLFALCINYVRMLAEAVSSIIVLWPNMSYASQILELPLEREEGSGESIDLSGDIELSHVSFSYNKSASTVIKDLSLHISAGEYIGIVGSSGCGKSTLIRLLLGFEKPDFGNIYFDGIDMTQLDIQCVRRQYGVVMQDAAILTGSIRLNIGLSEEADMDLVKNAARLASIDEDIEAMPMKYNTVLSGEAELVSGGQRQRIVLARSLMNNPKILILDEATSAMDNISQQRVKQNLDKLGITRIVVAHRLSTVKECDRIIVLDNGKLVEEGSFDELMELNGLFAKMARRNLIASNDDRRQEK